MSIGTGTDTIVTRGLEYYIDPANPLCFTDGDSVVNDIYAGGTSGSGFFSGSIMSGSLSSSDALKSFDLSPSEAHIRFNNDFFDFASGDPPFTVSLWFKSSGSAERGGIFGVSAGVDPNNAGGYVPAIYIGTTNYLYTSCFWGGSTSNLSVYSTAVNDNIWHNVTVTYTTSGFDNHKTYVDGVLTANLTKNQSSFGSGTYYYFYGAGRSSTWSAGTNTYFGGKMGIWMWYSKQLTAEEVLQNYNALRHRYGR